MGTDKKMLRLAASSTGVLIRCNRSMSTVSIASEAAFTAHLSSSDKSKVVVYFTASWCGPCQRVAPDIEALSEKFAATADILKVDLDLNPELAEKHAISAVPTFLLLQKENGQHVESSRITGAAPQQVEELLTN